MAITITGGLVVATLTLAGVGAGSYAGIVSDIAVNANSIEKNGEQNKERYEDLKEGQKELRELLKELLKEQQE